MGQMKLGADFQGFGTSSFRRDKIINLAGWLSFGLQGGSVVLLSYMAKHDPHLDLIFQALSDPTRRTMLAQLGQGAQAVTALAQPTGLALPTVMRHLGVLEGAGLISTTKTGRARICRAEPAALAPAADWLATQRAQWEGRLDRLEAYVQTLMQETRDD